MNAAVRALRCNDIDSLKAVLESNPLLAGRGQLAVEAARLARLQALRLLHRKGADLNAVWRGYRPLHSLIQEHPHHGAGAPTRERLRCLDWLLNKGANPELPGAWPPARALLVAAFAGATLFAERLLEAGARYDAFVACAFADVARVRRELRLDPSLPHRRDAGGLTALQCCAGSRLGIKNRARQEKLLQVAVLLLDAGADPNINTKSWDRDVNPVYFAASAGNAAMLELLLIRGADATAALVPACWQDGHDLSEICLRHGAKPNEARDGDRPLLNEMVRWGRVQKVLWLLERGADPNVPDRRGWTALHQAASRGNERMFKALVKAGGDLKRKDLEGRTPLAMANLATRAVLSGLTRNPTV